ncbi:MAG: hypothetical protein M1818_004958 [Claussenomyces sp. TS43310]|nr:MAG: hypothetical protein M1818_004958 [Claussenomyces sp. TS43310]
MPSTQSVASRNEPSEAPRTIPQHYVILGDAEHKLSAQRSLAPNNQYATSATTSLSSLQLHDLPEGPTTTIDNEAQTQNDQGALSTAIHASGSELYSSTEPSALGDNIGNDVSSSDLWSAAYREAVDSLGKDIDVAILKGGSVAQLFRQLDEIDKEATQESAFLRGVRYLHSIQVPLERFKLALDLASPLTELEPTVATVFGVVRSVTAIAISFAAADLEFAKQIGEMLEQISYIDDCDTLGQKSDREDIHKALVLVYQKILEFYKVAFEILTRKGAKLVMKMILENDRLPSIVEDFLKQADNLRKLVQKATWEIVEDIKAMLYDHENPQFINWYSASDSQQLVILGEMGCGKTVAMAFLVDELRRRNECQIPQPKTCYYYCRDDETGQAIHIFSALILALLEQFSGLKKRFFEWYKQAQASGYFEPAAHIEKLEEFLQNILEAIDRPLFIIIDGLDECDRASRNGLLRFLNTLLQKTPRLKVILSCRPQEEILEQLGETAKINLSSDTERDSIIVQKTVERHLCYLSNGVQALVIESLSRLAQGSAIWTKMIIELIEVRGIRALRPMRLFLREIPLPGQLSRLYLALLSRYTSNDPENQELASTALKILAITRRPLSILELAWGVALGSAQQEVTTVAALAELVDHQRVMSLIQPFITHVDFRDTKKLQIGLVHQSAKEFIIKQLTSNQSGLQGQAISITAEQALISKRIEILEGGILNICIKYLLLEEIGRIELFTEEQVAIEELPQEFDLFNDVGDSTDYDVRCTWEAWEENMIRYDPIDRSFGEFFVYASCHWLEHFGTITAEPLPDLRSVERLCQAGSIRLQNWIQQNCRPDCTIKPRFEFDSSLYDPLSITSLYGSAAMLRYMLEKSDFDNENFLPEPAVGAADQIFQWGDFSRIRMLFLEGNVKHQLQNLDFFRLVMRRWFYSDEHGQDWDLMFDLINNVLDKVIEEQWGNELLCKAAGMGCMPILRRLFDRAQDEAELRAELLRESRREQSTSSSRLAHQSIGEAVLEDHVGVVEYLLEQTGIEGHLQYRNSRGENVLHLASKVCNPEMFRLLVPCFKEGVHQTDSQGNTVMTRVIMSSSPSHDRYESAKILLLEGSANENSCPTDEQQDPLRIAVRLGDLEMCRLLVSVGKLSPLSAMVLDNGGKVLLRDETAEHEQSALAILQLLCTYANIELIST